ncbi:MAG: hypothetical protein ACRC3H_15195 [Lachnospiraceae bacterium]
MKKKIMIALCLTASLAVLTMTGCKKEEETEVPDQETVEEEQVEEEEVLKTIGVEEEDAFKVKLTNSTGKDIKGLSIKMIDEEEFPESLIEAEGDVYAIDESVYLYYKPTEEEQTEEAAEGDEDERLLTPGYDIQLTFADDTVVVLHSFPFDDIEEGALYLEEEVAFLKYDSVSSGDSVETKEAELAIKEQEKAAAEAAQKAAEEQAAAEAAAAEQAAAEAAAAEKAAAEAAAAKSSSSSSSSGSSGASSSSGSGSSSGSAASTSDSGNSGSSGSTSNDDGCVGDDALTY